MPEESPPRRLGVEACLRLDKDASLVANAKFPYRWSGDKAPLFQRTLARGRGRRCCLEPGRTVARMSTEPAVGSDPGKSKAWEVSKASPASNTNDIVRVYIDNDPAVGGGGRANAGNGNASVYDMHQTYKSLSISPTMTAHDVLNQVAKKTMWTSAERQKYALVMIDQATFGLRNRKKARTLKKTDLPGKIRQEKVEQLQDEIQTQKKVFDEKTLKEPVRLILKHTLSPLDLDAEYCGSSADEEEDNVEANYTISDDADNYILKGYLYKRGAKDELVWYKRWFVLYRGSLWYWKSRHSQIDPTEIPLANAKIRTSPIAKKNRYMRLAFEIETPTRMYHLRGLTANSTVSTKSSKVIEKEHYENYLKWMGHIENQITLASENCHMQLAEFYLKDHQIRASKAETRHVEYILSSLKLLLQDNAGQQCLRRFMETYVIAMRVAFFNIHRTNSIFSIITTLFHSYNKENLVLFYIDAAVFRKRANSLIHDTPEKRRNVSNPAWKDGVMDLWALAYAIYEQYIDEPKMDIFSKQPELARVKLDVYTEPPSNAMFEKLQREVYNTIEIEVFDAFKRHKESVALLTAMVLKRYAIGGKYMMGGSNMKTSNPFG